MGVLLPNYPEENTVKGDNLPNFSKMTGGKTGNGTSHGMQNSISYVNTGNGTVSGTPDGTSNVFQILNNIRKRWRAIQCQYDSSMVPRAPETETPFRTTTPSTPATTSMTAKQVDSVHVHALPVQNTSQSGPPAHCAHVHKLPRKVQHPHNGRTSVNRLPLMKQDILSHYSSCFEGIGHFPGDPSKFHLKPEHKPARHAPKKSSNPPWRCIQRGNQVFGGTRHSRRGKGTQWLGQLICNCGKGLWKPPHPKSHNQEETEDLFGS